MSVVVPNFASSTEDRASGALIVDGGLRFDKDKLHYLSWTPSSSGNRNNWTISCWMKRGKLDASQRIFHNNSSNFFIRFGDSVLQWNDGASGSNGENTPADLLRDTSSWYHLVFSWDSSLGVLGNAIYINGRLTQYVQTGGGNPNTSSGWNVGSQLHTIGANQINTGRYYDGLLSNVYFIDGQTLGPEYFGYTDPLTNTWRPKKLSSSIAFGTNGFYLPFDGSAPIGQDQSGNGNNWTPVNFGGSNTLEKATGALPILNTDGGGKVARVGVRTDATVAAGVGTCVLALPLVGVTSDFSNQIDSRSTQKIVTNNNSVSFASTIGNFYTASASFISNTSSYLSCSPPTELGNGNFTIEFWTYITANQNDKVFYLLGNSSSYGLLIYLNASKIEIYGSSTGNSWDLIPQITLVNIPPLNTWHHIAIVREGTSIRGYFNGVSVSLATSSNSFATPTKENVGGSGSANSLPGYIQDLRIYKGVAKYTSNFIPASTDPDIVPDSPSGVSYSSNLTQITDGAVSFDGTGDYLSLASSSDFQFGTGDFTVEAFVYKSAADGDAAIFDLGSTNTSGSFAIFWNSGTLTVRIDGLGNDLSTTDYASNKWIHVAVARSGSTLRLFVDGDLKASGTRSNDITQSTPYIGDLNLFDYDFTGFISNLQVIKGTALYTSNFTPPSAPLTATENTKLLCCKSNSSATAFDVSPGIITSVNAVATNFNPFTNDINAVRGQESGYATLNPLDKHSTTTLANGNLDITASDTNNWYKVKATIAVSSGKWYWECGNEQVGGVGTGLIGVCPQTTSTTNYVGYESNSYAYYNFGGDKYTNATASAYGSSFSTGDVVGVALDMDAGTITFYKNGVSQGVAFTGISGTYTPAFSSQVNYRLYTNFGQKPFKFPPPEGFQPLALANTPRPTIVRPDQYVGIVTYKGTGSTLTTSLGFTPDFIWTKNRTSAHQHRIYDSVRGNNVTLSSNTTGAEETISSSLSIVGSGFTVGTSTVTNTNTDNYVSWCWKAGGEIGVGRSFMIDNVGFATAGDAGLTAGTITPTGASVNTKSGFSIIGYTGTDNASDTFSHGLTKKPDFAIFKNRTDDGDDWIVYHSSQGATKRGKLNLTNAFDSQTSQFNDTEPTSSIFTIGTFDNINKLNSTYIAYLWAEIPGFSKFGSYTGTDTSNYINLGFRPALIIIKSATKTSSSFSSWMIQDAERSPYNPTSGSNKLWANRSTQEGYRGDGSSTSNLAANDLDFDSNGFYIPSSASTELNETGQTFIYAAWAEAPTFNLYGAQANAR